ncbi:hypothetical protein CBR_g4577 [Chara braunii]|uniref:Integrase catalytic domain-containing protein n=1 Tax=Chara braunii TaxID=69332 RepID=A0A388KI89_CHABU|nr:hypothetical protein CBR_g4577 [Chara braunii]|eukprot:GBG69746.1 hypothetical protein CBR_g4577 [Chara braunii]
MTVRCIRGKTLGKGMATEEGIDDHQSGGNQGTNGVGERNEGSARDRKSAKPEGTREDGKDLSTGESSGKAGGSKRGPQENKERGNNMRTSPRNSAGTTPKKTKVSDARRKLTEIEKRTAKFKARLIEQMMVGDEEDPQGAGSREGRRISQDEARYGGKDNSHKGTPNKKGKDKDDPPAGGTKNAMTPPAIDSDTSRLPATPKIKERRKPGRSRGKARKGKGLVLLEKQRGSKEGEGTSAIGEAGSSEGGLKRIKGRFDAKLVPPVRIHTVQHECWNDKGPAYEFGITSEVTDLLRAKIDSFVVEPTGSPYANKWFVFRKPNKTLRWIQDLQKLNAVTIRDAGSLPQEDLLVESHVGRSIYSLIDLYSGYDQLPLDARDRAYTAMHTSVGQLQMQVTPIGFTNAVAEAQRRMLAIAGDMFPKKCEPYIDDNPIKGARYKDEAEVQPGVRKFVWDHLQDIKDLLQRFLVYNITASEPKSILVIPEVTILGFRCGAYGRKPDPTKTDKISQWPTPLRTTTEVRAFLGVVGFWRIFIKGFAKIAEPIRAMIREGGTMEWTEDREAAAQTLKDILSSDQVTLAAPCFNDEVGQPFILETDGGPMAVGGVLIQKSEEGKERPIRFESRTLNSAERRYSQFKKEVLAILYCLKTFQAYLFGRRFILRIDPTNVVRALKNYKPIDPTVDRWIGFIWQFDYKVKRIAGLRNRADGLSRDSWGAEVGAREELMAMAVEGGRDVVMTLAETWAQKECQYLVNKTREEQDTDQKEQEFFLIQMYEGIFREIGLLLVGNKQPMEVSSKAREEAEKYVLRNGHLFKKEEGMMPRRVVCGKSRQLDVIQAMHDGLAGGHRSSKGTLAKIVPLYFWPGMAGLVATYSQTCLMCQERSSTRVYEPLRPTRVLGPGHLVHLDLVVMPLSTDGFRYILDARDNLSGYVEAVALKRKTGKVVADWVEDFYLRHPFVRRFIADNGTNFVNQEVLNRLKILCVPIKIIEPYHPEANAPVERGHRTLKNTIAKLAADDLGNWSQYLRQAVFSENVTPKRTTGCIPAALWYGREIDFPVEVLVPTWNRLDDDPHLTTEEVITACCQQVVENEEALDELVDRVMDSRMRDKARGGKKQGTGDPSPLREGEPIVLPSESYTNGEEERNPGKRQRLEEKEPIEVIDLSSEEEEDEVTIPTREERGREEDSGKEKDKWIAEFGPTFSDWFDQWGAILRYQWAMKGREKLSRGEDLSPTTFFSEGTLLQLQGIKRQMQPEMEDRARREARCGAAGQ